MFGGAPALLPDLLSEARATVDRLSAALAKAEAGYSDARARYDRELQATVVTGKNTPEPSLEPQRAAQEKAASLKRLLDVARDHLARLTRDAADADRAAAIRASGSVVAALTTTAEAKLAEFEAAIATARRAEGE